MWTIVCFDEENTVEAVPAHWIKKNLCAWPKKNIKKCLERRTIPNKFDFNYFPSRVLKKGIATLREARDAAKYAERTSDLSSCETTQKRTSLKQFIEPPQYNETLYTNEQNDNDINYIMIADNVIESPKRPIEIPKNDSDCEIDVSIKKHKTSLRAEKVGVNRNVSMDNQAETSVSPEGTFNNKTLANYPSTSFDVPGKRQEPSVEDNNKLLKKILSVVLKTRYDVEALAQRQYEIDQIITSQIVHVKDASELTDQNEEFEMYLPITSEETLKEFEQKLITCSSFKSNAINGLRRFAKKTLTSTVRQMLRKLFDDKILQEYSYVGQKKKKIFSSLTTCAIIFEAVHKIKTFSNSTNADIETPIKVYIAGAAFRKEK